jgi:hypothetical protein
MQGKLDTLEELETMIDGFSSGKIAERFIQAVHMSMLSHEYARSK